MKITEIKEIARQYDLKTGKATKRELILAIQQAEGNQACFDQNLSTACGQESCAWRCDCN